EDPRHAALYSTVRDSLGSRSGQMAGQSFEPRARRSARRFAPPPPTRLPVPAEACRNRQGFGGAALQLRIARGNVRSFGMRDLRARYLPPNPVTLTQGEMKTMTKGSAWMLAKAVVSFAGPAAASPETGERVGLRSVSGG
ncbi:MAG: hypothetical protein ACREX9_03900, partial [Gammaproteobacteria bacterium]